jgi:hypothetical protein
VAKVLPLPSKRRTREHVIADQSVNYVEWFIYDAGFTAERFRHDYGYDLSMTTYDSSGYVEPDRVLFQIKASDRLAQVIGNRHFAVQLDVADLNSWLEEPMPVFLILYDAANHAAYWLYVQRHFQQNSALLRDKQKRSVTVHVPRRNRVTRSFIALARSCKDNILNQKVKEANHG